MLDPCCHILQIKINLVMKLVSAIMNLDNAASAKHKAR